MNLHDLVSEVIIDSEASLWAFLPELCLCATIVIMLLVRITPWGRRVDTFSLALVGSLLALLCAGPWVHLDPEHAAAATRMEIFGGMLVYDPLTVFMRGLLIGFAVLFAIFTKLSGIPDREDGPDVYSLVLGATLGMCLMASANHLLMVFMAMEMASVPSYVLAGLVKGRRIASEAALKYSIYGAGTAGVMLYGISLIAGLVNTAHLPTVAHRLAERLPMMTGEELAVLGLAGLMIMVGLAFKLSAVPFHFWCPDVFEGATAEVDAFLSVASKAAALALLVRVSLGLGAIPYDDTIAQEVAATHASSSLVPIAVMAADAENDQAAQGADARGLSLREVTSKKVSQLAPARDFIGHLVALLAVITCTFGNLAAYAQTNIKRLLAYSTIAHAGYMMMAVPALMAMVGRDTASAQTAVSALVLYLSVYLFMNLGAFAIVAFLRNVMRSEEIADYAGLIRRCPVIVICFAIILFGLVGLPPLSGFLGKFAVFASLVKGYQVSAAAGSPQGYLIGLLIVGGINTVISLFYYLRIVKVMAMEAEPADRSPFTFPAVSLASLYVCFLTAPTALLILNWDALNRWTLAAAQYLLA